MSRPTEQKRAGNWVKTWKPYNWQRKSPNQITTKKAEINAYLLKKYEASFSDAKRDTMSKRQGWYPSKTTPGTFRKYFFMWRKPGGGKAIVNPTTPPQP